MIINLKCLVKKFLQILIIIINETQIHEEKVRKLEKNLTTFRDLWGI